MSRHKRTLVLALSSLLILVAAWAGHAMWAYQGYSGSHVIGDFQTLLHYHTGARKCYAR